MIPLTLPFALWAAAIRSAAIWGAAPPWLGRR